MTKIDIWLLYNTFRVVISKGVDIMLGKDNKDNKWDKFYVDKTDSDFIKFAEILTKNDEESPGKVEERISLDDFLNIVNKKEVDIIQDVQEVNADTTTNGNDNTNEELIEEYEEENDVVRKDYTFIIAFIFSSIICIVVIILIYTVLI